MHDLKSEMFCSILKAGFTPVNIIFSGKVVFGAKYYDNVGWCKAPLIDIAHSMVIDKNLDFSRKTFCVFYS